MRPPVFDLLEQDMERDAALPFVDLASRYFLRTRDGTDPVSTALTSAEIAPRFDEPLPLGGRPLNEVAARIEHDVMSAMNRLAHPMCMGHQVSAPLPIAVWMEAVIAAMNQSVAVAEMSPSATVVETQLVRWMTGLIGWDGSSGGTLTSGGTEATFTALLAARAAALPNAWERGVGAGGAAVPVVLCGEHAHYAVTRAVAQLGLGLERAIAIPSRDWRMDPDALAARLDTLAGDGVPVMAVVATAGSTATGSFDDLETIAMLCDARGVWLHVDAAHGGSALLSAVHRDRLRGLTHARSVAWDAHKMMLLPLAAGMLFVRDERDLDRAFAQQAPYLFHGDQGERTWDQGTRSFQCSRRADALKMWAVLQRYGAAGLGEIYDHLCQTTRDLHAAIAVHPDFVALHEPESNILCFRCVGRAGEDDVAVDTFNRELRERYNRSGRGWITTTMLGGRRVLRVTVMNPRTGRDEVLALLDGLCDEAAAMRREAEPGHPAPSPAFL
jgi:L-2,4-diaminobutyrate decarboxylase